MSFVFLVCRLFLSPNQIITIVLDNLTQVNYEILSDKKIPHLLAMFSWFTRLFLRQDSQNQISSPINTFPCFIGAPI
ncbi:uncharacterized protein LOC123894414 isoform X3 [Trifolium pratense]|uniref:uncharacterized protein LOC123894414 isoform X3 n=1 Tax=Trifolium pratense TaxID=57577 RepID=UPI001E6932CD|nr:uncharacterized protein LOC123894414 isoform X3 [Trifolium pratense]